MSVRLSVCLSARNNSAPSGRILMKFDICVFLGICAVPTYLGHPYWIYIIPTHDMHQWLLLQFLVLLMMDAESAQNM